MTLFLGRLAEYKVGDLVPLSGPFFAREDDTGAWSVSTPATLDMLMVRNVIEVSGKLWVSGAVRCLTTIVRIRDERGDVEKVLEFIRDLKIALKAQTFTFTSDMYSGYTLYEVVYQP